MADIVIVVIVICLDVERDIDLLLHPSYATVTNKTNIKNDYS